MEWRRQSQMAGGGTSIELASRSAPWSGTAGWVPEVGHAETLRVGVFPPHDARVEARAPPLMAPEPGVPVAA